MNGVAHNGRHLFVAGAANVSFKSANGAGSNRVEVLRYIACRSPRLGGTEQHSGIAEHFATSGIGN
jgi:hypothetical protein